MCSELGSTLQAYPDAMEQQVQQLQEQLSIKEQENRQLMAQLAHLRSWMNSLQQRARANDPHALLVARELYVGGVPEGTTEVRWRLPAWCWDPGTSSNPLLA